MSFVSWEFCLLFLVVAAVMFYGPWRWQWMQLLLASLVFYGWWNPWYVLLLLGKAVLCYVCALGIASGRGRRFFLYFGLSVNLGILAVFKYYNFFGHEFASWFSHDGQAMAWSPLNVLLPVGISFYTFQTMAYLIEVYRGNTKAERHFGIFLLYVVFFPQLEAGPIERPNHLLPQLQRLREACRPANFAFDYTRVTSGLRLFAWGFFKKIVLADSYARYADAYYTKPASGTGLDAIFATWFFAWQIYLDFSAYTDMARGCARVLGVDLIENFQQPYLAQSIPEFWRRWHISLTTWFRDYVYYPLGGNRVEPWRWRFNVMAVFLLSGLWHGANWTFIIWGALHAIFYFVTVAIAGLGRPRDSTAPGASGLRKYVSIILTFNLVCLGWVFFRASSLTEAWQILGSGGRFLLDAATNWQHFAWGVEESFIRIAVGRHFPFFAFLFGATFFVEWLELNRRRVGREIGDFIAAWPTTRRWAFYYAMALGIIVFNLGGAKQFIYFQF